MLTAALIHTIELIGAMSLACGGVVLCEENPPARDATDRSGGAR